MPIVPPQTAQRLAFVHRWTSLVFMSLIHSQILMLCLWWSAQRGHRHVWAWIGTFLFLCFIIHVIIIIISIISLHSCSRLTGRVVGNPLRCGSGRRAPDSAAERVGQTRGGEKMARCCWNRCRFFGFLKLKYHLLDFYNVSISSTAWLTGSWFISAELFKDRKSVV